MTREVPRWAVSTLVWMLIGAVSIIGYFAKATVDDVHALTVSVQSLAVHATQNETRLSAVEAQLREMRALEWRTADILRQVELMTNEVRRLVEREKRKP